MDIRFSFNGIHVDIGVDETGKVALWNCSAVERPREGEGGGYPLAEVQGAGYNHNNHHALKHSLTSPASERAIRATRSAETKKGIPFCSPSRRRLCA